MVQRYTVFLNDKAVIISQNINILEIQSVDTIVKYSDNLALEDVFRKFSNSTAPGNLIIIAQPDFDKACSSFNNLFKKICAAGGIVKNDNGEYLFIKRFGLWDLPKGKLNKHESIEQGALREVTEETGLTNLSMKKQLSCSYHIYKDRAGLEILKETFWFEMYCEGYQILIPQTEEGITEVKWFDEATLFIPLNETYESLKHLWEQYKQS
jgi:8-oxo-dGTP pyrophosphatase MutT (NUDIX family)